MIAAAQREWAPKGVAFIAVSLDEKRNVPKIPAFLKKYGIAMPVWTGATAADLDRFRLGDGIPDTVFLDKSGAAIFRVLGEIRKPEVEQRLEWLSGNRTAPRPQAMVHNM